MVRLLYAFSVLFPFLIYPWGRLINEELPKSDYLSYFVSVMWLVFLYRWVIRHDPMRRPDLADGLLLAYALLVGLSTLLAVNVPLAIYGAPLRYEGMVSLLCYASLCFFASRTLRPEHLRLLTGWMVCSGSLAAIYGILQYWLLDPLPRPANKVGARISYSFFDNPNFFGTFLVIMLLLALHHALTSVRRWQKIGFGVQAGILFQALLYANTRSAWLGFAVAWLLVLYYSVTYERTWLVRWAGYTLLLLALFLGNNQLEHNHFTKRASTIVTDMESALTHSDNHAGSNRWYIWKKALPLVPPYFWHGSGPDTFALVFPRNPDELRKYLYNPDIVVDKAHNEYLQTAITLGVPTLLVYVSLLLVVVRRCLRTIASSPVRRPVAIGLLSVVVGYAVQAFFNISVVAVAPYLWMTLGMCLTMTRMTTESG